MQRKGDDSLAFTPDVFITPGIVLLDETLQPLDSKVYAIVYWLEHLRDGKCTASNKTIGKKINSSSSGVANALVRLRERGYIGCEYDDEGHRKAIRTLVKYSVYPYSNEDGGVTQMSNKGSNNKSIYTSEMQEKIAKVYKAWLVYMVVEPGVREHGGPEEKSIAYAAATKRVRLTEKRRTAIARRLNDFDTPDLIKAIRNISNSPFHRDGIQSNGDTGTFKASIEWLFKSYEKTEEWINKNAD